MVNVAVKVDITGTAGTEVGPASAILIAPMGDAAGVTGLDGVDCIPAPPALTAWTTNV